MVAAPFAALIRGIGHDRVVSAMERTDRHQTAHGITVTERVAEVAPHRPDHLVEGWRANRRLDLVDRRHPVAATRRQWRPGGEKGAVVGHDPMLGDKRGGIEPGPGDRAGVGGRGQLPVRRSVFLERAADPSQPADGLRPAGIVDEPADAGDHKDAGGQRRGGEDRLVEPGQRRADMAGRALRGHRRRTTVGGAAVAMAVLAMMTLSLRAGPVVGGEGAAEGGVSGLCPGAVRRGSGLRGRLWPVVRGDRFPRSDHLQRPRRQPGRRRERFAVGSDSRHRTAEEFEITA